MPNDERLREALDRLKNAFCGCDVMRGYTCGIHAHIVAIEQAAAPEPRTASFVPTKNGIRKSNELCSTKFRDLWGDECDCDRDKEHIGSHSRWVRHVESAAPEPQPAPGPAQHDIQRGQYVWVKGVVVGGDQPRDFPKRARIHVYGIGTGIPKEFKPVTDAAQPSPAPAGESALRDEVAWLIERDQLCLGIRASCGYRFTWVTFTDKDALRFSRKEDAYCFMEAVKWKPFDLPLEGAFVTEHLWCAALASHAEKEKP